MPTPRQRDFIAAVIDRERPVPDGISSWNAERPQRRFGVYRNNVSSALIEAVAIRYPAVQRLVGEEFFRTMTREFVLSHLPHSPVLIRYGGDFPAFIEKFEPARSLAYLGDVARLESAYWEAYHAADGEPMSAGVLAALTPDQLARARFDFLPAVRVVVSRYPIVSIWHTNTHDEDVRAVDLTVGEDALVSRPGLDVEIRKLPEGASTFLRSLMAGETLAEAVATAAAEGEPGFDLALNLKGLIKTGIIARIRLP